MKKFFPVIILTVISSLLIFYRFTYIPKYLAYDEVEFTKLALSLNNKPYTPYSPLATGHSTLYFYVLSTTLKIFGINTFALRLPAAIFGILSVIIFYLVIKKLKNYELHIANFNVLPFILTVIFLTSRWFLNFSRFSFEATFLLFLELTSIYYLLKFNEELKAKISNFYIFFSGIFAGLAFLSYTPGRIFFLLPIGFLLSTMKQWNNITIKRLLYFIIPFVIIVTPLSSYLLINKDTRIDQQFFLKNHEMPIQEKISGLWHNISSTALMFNIKGDVNGRHNYPGKPALNPILGLLFMVGLFITIKRWNNNENKLFLAYFVLSIFPALMTYPWENPNMLRTITVLPSVVYLIGNGIYYLSKLADRSFNKVGVVSKLSSNKKIFASCFLFCVILFSCFYELRTYFKYQSTVFKQSFEIKLPLEKAIKVKLKP